MRFTSAEPVRLYWGVGIAVSLALHASGGAAAILFADRYVRQPERTEIVFSDLTSQSAPSPPQAVEPAALDNRAEVAKPEAVAAVRVEALAADQAKPLAPLAAGRTAPEAISPSAAGKARQEADANRLSAENTSVSQPEVARPVAALQPAEPARVSGGEPQERASDARVEALAAVEQAVAALQNAAGSIEPDAGRERISELADPPAASSLASAERVTGLSGDRATPSSAGERAPSSGGAEYAAAAGAQAVASAMPADRARPTSTGEKVASGGSGIERLPASGDSAGGAVASGDQAERVAPVERPMETALLVPARPGSLLGTEVDRPSDRYRRIIDFVRGFGGGPCFIALPAMNASGEVTFQTFGRDKKREDAFRRALQAFDGLRSEISSGNVADPQCIALAFARQARRYPGFSLIIDLDEAEMRSGTRLSGAILNANGRDVHLLLVDDEGRVQSLDAFLSPATDADRRFEVPLTLTSGPVATKQILVAIFADVPLPSLEGPVDQPAAAYFEKLEREIDAAGADIDLAVEGFSVR